MFKATIKIILILLWLAIACIFAWLIKKIAGKKYFAKACNVGFAGLCFIINLRIKTVGEIAAARPLLLVSNHISYIDVLVLGAKTPALFTPKSDIASWPIIGGICRLLNAVFIERKPEKLHDASYKIKNALAEGEVISLFAEGTTGNGRHLLPFKSSLFSIAEEAIEGKEVWVQPAIIKYTHIRRLPIDSTKWPRIAWYGDMRLAPHLWEFLKLGKIDITLTLLPPVTSKDIGNRKKLAAYCQDKTEMVLHTH